MTRRSRARRPGSRPWRRLRRRACSRRPDRREAARPGRFGPEAFFTSEMIRKGSGLGDPSSVPAFIIGVPRSGSTLVEQTLAKHPQAHAAGEPGEFGVAMVRLCAPGATAPGVGGEDLRQIGARYLERAPAAAPAAGRVTDKLPANFRYVGLIHLALPNARIIHMRRDPI